MGAIVLPLTSANTVSWMHPRLFWWCDRSFLQALSMVCVALQASNSHMVGAACASCACLRPVHCSALTLRCLLSDSVKHILRSCLVATDLAKCHVHTMAWPSQVTLCGRT